MPETGKTIRPTDDEARKLARDLLDQAQHAALAVIEPGTGAPHVSRIAFALGPDRGPLTLVSDLALHARALRRHPLASLLIGEPGYKGDPLTHPRLTLQVRAAFVARDIADHAAIRDAYLKARPKAKLYADFADFHFVRFDVLSAALNGGFGRAFHLTPGDLGYDE